MAREQNTNRNGGSWTTDQIKNVWEMGRIIPDFSANTYRWDICGQVMQFDQHGNRSSDSGWEIDHKNPVENGGLDDYTNLQPLNWKNNLAKSDKLNWRCGQ